MFVVEGGKFLASSELGAGLPLQLGRANATLRAVRPSISASMSREEVQRQTECIARLAEQLAKQPRLSAELQRARRQFFGEDQVGAGNDAAEHRFAEWFLLERESETLGAVPATIPPYSRDVEELEGSLVGLFMVESVGSTIAATDMQDESVIEIADVSTLQVGDLLVGRLYPVGGERWAPSAATPALRPGREIATAFVRDLEKLELGRRLYQVELEHLLLRQYGGSIATIAEPDQPAAAAVAAEPLVPELPAVPLEHLEADLEQLLLSVGEHHSATVLSQQLAVAERPGQCIGPLLDQLAFDTDVDLDKARRLLLEIWNAHHAGPARSTEQAGGSAGAPGESLGEQLARKIDEGIGESQDVEALFGQIERLAGIEPEEDDDDDERNTKIVAEVFGTGDDDGDAGDLSPLVTEFHWETGAESTDESALRLWIELQRNAPVPNTDLETIQAQDLMRLLLHVYLRSSPDERADQVRAAFEELRLFYDWVLTTQEIDRREVLGQCKGTLLQHLDRLQRAGAALSNDDPPVHSPGLLQVEEVGADGFGARDDDGGSYWLLCAQEAVKNLAVGDLVLAGLAATTGDEQTSMHRRPAGLVVVMPIDARSLIE